MRFGEFLDTNEIAEAFATKPDTIRLWRREGRGPRWVRIEGRVLYSVADVQEWLATRETSESRVS